MNATAALVVGPVEVASALRPEGVTTADLARLLALVLDAQQQQTPPEVVADQVESQVPIFADLGVHLCTGPGQLQLLSLIIPMIISIFALLRPPAAPPAPPAPPVVVNVQAVPNQEQITAIVEKEMREHGMIDQAPDEGVDPETKAADAGPSAKH